MTVNASVLPLSSSVKSSPFCTPLKPSDDAVSVCLFLVESPIREASPACDGQVTHFEFVGKQDCSGAFFTAGSEVQDEDKVGE